MPVGVGGSDDPVAPPRDDEEHGLLGLEDDPALGGDPVPRHDEVHALGGADPEPPAAAREALQLIGPDARRVDHHPRLDVGGRARLDVLHPHASNAVRLLQEADDLSRRPHDGAVRGGGARDGQRVPGVVDRAVVVTDSADEGVFAQRRHQPQCAGARQVLVPGHRPRAAHRVVQHETRCDVRTLDRRRRQRVEERHRLGQVRTELGEHQLALAQRLADQPELEHLEVAQTAVEELRGPRRRARGDVSGLDERDRQPPGHGIERGAGTDHAAADHHHVEGVPAEPVERLAPLRRTQPRRRDHSVTGHSSRPPADAARVPPSAHATVAAASTRSRLPSRL